MRVEVAFSDDEMKLLDAMLERCGYKHRSVLVRNIVRDVLDDDARAHGEPGLKEPA